MKRESVFLAEKRIGGNFYTPLIDDCASRKKKIYTFASVKLYVTNAGSNVRAKSECAKTTIDIQPFEDVKHVMVMRVYVGKKNNEEYSRSNAINS